MKGIALSYMKLDRDELETYAVFNNGRRVGEVYHFGQRRRGYWVHSLGRLKHWKTKELAALDLLAQGRDLNS